MIFVDRTKVPPPEWFGSLAWGKAQYALLQHFSTKASARSQTRTIAVAGPLPAEVEKDVWTLFEGRCAMCESKLKSGPACVKRFRPVETEDSKDRYVNAYAALLWENLILLCPGCDRARGDRFPVAGSSVSTNERLSRISFDLGDQIGSRKAYEFLANELAEARLEEPYQIDPTVEQPIDFLIFEDNGLVRPFTRRGRDRTIRGEDTIKIFHLNRPELVSQRVSANRRIGVFPRIAMPQSGRDVQAAARVLNSSFVILRPVLDALGGEFQAAKAFHTVRWLRTGIRAPVAEIAPLLKWPLRYRQSASRVLIPAWLVLAKEKTVVRWAKVKLKRGQRERSIPAATRPFSRRRITRIRLKNFRHFRDADFALPLERPEDAFGPDRELAARIREAGLGNREPLPEPEAYCGWKMLLGENGVGKSSILHAIALALLADETGKKAIEQLTDLRHNVAQDATRGSIEVWIEGRPKPIRLGFSANRVSLTGAIDPNVASPAEPKSILFLRGYGAARLLPPRAREGAEVAPLTDAPAQEVRNLFNPHFPLANPTRWLQGLDDESRLLAFITLKDLLDLPAKSFLAFQEWHGVKNTFGLIQGGRFVPLEFFSAGYQSIVALGCDIMAGFGKAVGDMQKRAGIVLLDEIGTNLHPRWRLRIVQALRRAFPLFQFIASTHEPLCLRGLGQGEVALLTLEGGPSMVADDGSQLPEKPADVVLRDDLPSPAIYRVDQLLTGDFFGLQTAYDPDEEAAFDAYHALLVRERTMAATGAPLPPEQAALLGRLRARLKDRINLGDTVAERQVMAELEKAERERSERPGRREPLQGSPEAKAAATRLLQQLPPSTPPTP